MAASGQSPRDVEKLLGSPEKVEAPALAYKIGVISWTGWALIILGIVTLLGGAIATLAWTSPPMGPCFPPGGASSIPCPASELTPNNLAVIIVITVGSIVVIAWGGVLVCLAWLHKPPPA
jgi:hypothetical protein